MSKMEKETRLKLAIALSLVFMLIEVVGGYVANSIAIFSDAAHLLTDIAGFGIALVATLASKAPATKRLTFGFARAEVFGALASVLSLWVITFFLLYAAYDRALKWYLGRAEEVNGFLMFIVACFGVVVNICLGYVFHEDHGGGLHPGHSHEHHHHHSNDVHSDSGSYQKVDLSDLESPAGDDHDHGHGHGHGHDDGHDCAGHDHSEKKRHTPTEDYEHIHDDHDHGHDHGKGEGSCSGHDHNHHSTATEKSPLLGGHKSKSYTDDHSHDKSEHDHHGHDHHDHHGHDHHGHREHSDHHDDHHDHHGHGGEHLHESDVNIEAAYLHVLTDLIQSIGVAIAGVIMWRYPHYEIIDPICTLVFSIIALYSTLPLLSRVFLILFEGTPTQIDWETVMEKFNAIQGVENVHDLHIWNISSTSISLTCHMRASNPQHALKEANQICKKLGIHHTTIQVHHSSDKTFCYSEMCDGENEEHNEGKETACMSSHSLKKKDAANAV